MEDVLTWDLESKQGMAKYGREIWLWISSANVSLNSYLLTYYFME